jgi:hypothetical protein
MSRHLLVTAWLAALSFPSAAQAQAIPDLKDGQPYGDERKYFVFY